MIGPTAVDILSDPGEWEIGLTSKASIRWRTCSWCSTRTRTSSIPVSGRLCRQNVVVNPGFKFLGHHCPDEIQWNVAKHQNNSIHTVFVQQDDDIYTQYRGPHKMSIAVSLRHILSCVTCLLKCQQLVDFLIRSQRKPYMYHTGRIIYIVSLSLSSNVLDHSD